MNRMLGAVRSLFGIDGAKREFIRNQRNLTRVREAMLVLAPPGHALKCEGVALASAEASRWQHERAQISAAQLFVKGSAHFSVSLASWMKSFDAMLNLITQYALRDCHIGPWEVMLAVFKRLERLTQVSRYCLRIELSTRRVAINTSANCSVFL